MENLITAFKLIGPMMLTPIINRFISTFRIRQLYLSFDDALACILPQTDGFVTNVRIYNKGKDKESEIEIIFPNTSLCQIISTSYPSVSSEENRILIDRVLPKQIINLTVYLKAARPISGANKPFIKSEDTNGKAYNDRNLVPGSLGPAVMAASIVAAGFITFMYVMLSGSNILYPYYAVRYKSFIEQGFKPSSFSSTELISSSGFGSKPPLSISEPYIENSQIVIPISLKNTTKEKIIASIYTDLGNADYSAEIQRASKDNYDILKRVKAWQAVGERYGYSSGDNLDVQDFPLAPNEEKVLLLRKSVITSTTLANFNLRINIQSGGESDFKDYYQLNMEESNEKARVIELIKQLRP